jgi:hypothetical protein
MHSNVPQDLPCEGMSAMTAKTKGVFYILRFVCCVFFVSELETAKDKVLEGDLLS